MKKIVLIPDSFKGTMSSMEICRIMQEQITQHYPDAAILAIPVADGGEGSVDCFLSAVPGERIACGCVNPYFEEMTAVYGQVVTERGERAAVIEMAACAGLPLVEDRKNPMETTSYGVGQLILDAIERGAGEVILCLGGSCTNDAGCGAAAAMGAAFYNENGESFIPVGGTLKDITHIDLTKMPPAVRATRFVTMCDIDNPMYGECGAAHVFAPQKGADEAQVKLLDEGLRHLSAVLQAELGMDLSQIPGGGAAGAMGAGAAAFLGAELKMGIEAVLDAVSFEQKLQGADLVFTGEGKIDGQSLRGKVVIGVARRAKKLGIPVIAVVGDIDDDVQPAYAQGVSAIVSINRVAVEYSAARKRAPRDLAMTMDTILRLYRLWR